MHPYTLILLLFLSIPGVTFAQRSNILAPGNATGKQAGYFKNIPTYLGFVNDYEGLFSNAESRRLDSLLRAFETKTTRKIVVVTLDSTIVSRADFDDFTLMLGNTWGVGGKAGNNGMLIGMSASMRHIRIQNGYETESILSDSLTSAIIQDCFLPAFRKRNYFDGIWTGILEIMEWLK